MNNNRTTEKEVSQFLDDAMMEYSAYVILHRAIPILTDGLKISYRRILYTMFKNGMVGHFTKSATVEGRVMEIHPHSGTYPTMVNMTQKDNNNIPWLVGKGTFGQHTSRDMQAAAQRYTEVKLSPYAIDMMEGIKKGMVEMKPTFDGTSFEPLELPVKHPQILTISQQGMAVGMASNIPSFNLKEVCQATIDYINGKDTPTLIPDLATGGEIINDSEQFKSINETGKGTFRIRSKYEVDGQYILVKEIPYTTTREEIIDKIIDLVKAGKIKNIADIKDTTDINGMEIEIKMKHGTNADKLMQMLFKLTPLENAFSVNMTVLDNNVPRVLGVKQIIPKWVEWRTQKVKALLINDIQEKKKKLHILKGLEKCLIDIDKVIDIIKNCTDEEMLNKLSSTFGIDNIQAEAVASMKIRNINKDVIAKKIADITVFEKEIEDNQNKLETGESIKEIIINDLQEIAKKYGQPRKTEIVYRENDLTKTDLVEDYSCHLVITQQGYIKKNLKYSDKQKLKDEDSIVSQIATTNKSKTLIFTDKANCYFLNTYKLNECLPSALGTYLPSLLELQDEKIIYVTTTSDYSGYMYFAFENGKVAKVPLSSYQTKQNRGMIVGAYNTNSKLVFIKHIIGTVDFMAKKNGNQYMVFSSDLLNEKTGKKSQGMITIQIKEGEALEEFHENTLSMAESSLCTYLTLNKAGKKLDI